MAQNSKIGVMKANQSFCCGFCFEGRSRDELSTISDFLSWFRRKFIRHVTLVSLTYHRMLLRDSADRYSRRSTVILFSVGIPMIYLISHMSLADGVGTKTEDSSVQG